MKVIIFGLGNTGKTFFKTRIDRNLDKVIAFTDNNDKFWNTTYEDISVIPPNEIYKYECDCVVVASVYAEEIITQLNDIGIKAEILRPEDYVRYLYTRERYSEAYSTKEIIKKKIFDDEIVVYTAITGNYDNLNDPCYFAPGIRYVCFTNNREIKSDKWEMNYISDTSLDDIHLARHIKFFPNKYLKECDTSVWVDGKFQVIGDIREYIGVFQKDKPMLCFPHFERKCLYDEAAKLISYGIGIKKDIIDQITYYNSQGYPIDNGLIETGCIIRKHNDSTVINLMNDWWTELKRFSYRDQISLPYVCWKNDFIPDISDQNLYKNKWLLCTRGYSKAMTNH
ncbi:glycosyltransferase domain-containing protein [Butyrivibrio sp. INlla21]|uniref:glycosyltransferase domain-containing protein n=1 Tax=Butyrivibrio sp. INlla21 TaxID=1520811 RepID=UPI0008F0A667|nr:glycosyltransferase domain-containing protein [Butyrivibrio sp. INlla21]SFV03785.1 Protein of unknown function [Butyrivibrio sp. INlla21]